MRRPRVWIAVGLGALACVAILLAGLPTVVRRIAVGQIRALTARETVIDEVQLNLFTRRLAVRGFRLADREGREPLARFEALEVRFSPLPLFRGRLHLDALVLRGLRLRLVRTGPAEPNISDILARFSGRERLPRTIGPGASAVTPGRLRTHAAGRESSGGAIVRRLGPSKVIGGFAAGPPSWHDTGQ